MGLAVAVVHWIVVLFAMFGDPVEPHFGFNPTHSQTYLWEYLLTLNFPALLVTHVISSPIIFVFQLSSRMNVVYSIVAVICVTVQWLSLGSALHFVVSTRNKTERQTLNINPFVR